MMELVVCCNDLAIRKWLGEVIEDYSTLHHALINVRLFADGKNLVSSMEIGYRYHIVILDITDTTGPPDMELPKKIRKYDTSCLIIIIANSAGYALWGYAVHAYDYWVKPLDKGRVLRTIDEAAGVFYDQHCAIMPVKAKGINTPVKYANIMYIESAKHHLKIHMMNGTVYQVYGKLDEYAQRLTASASFLRCHQSFLVNMDHVESISGRDFIMRDGSNIPIRKSSAAKLKKEYYQYALRQNG